MKKLAFIAVLACSTFVSCNDDDNNTEVNTGASLTGTWKLTAFNVAEPFDLNNDGTSSQSLITE
jgi:hypothetical protein